VDRLILLEFLGEVSGWPEDEYESYIVPTFMLLEKGADFTELNNYISYIIKEYIRNEFI